MEGLSLGISDLICLQLGQNNVRPGVADLITEGGQKLSSEGGQDFEMEGSQ